MDPFWEDQPGATPDSNWFKDHPKTTLVLLLAVAAVLVVVSI